MTRIEVVRHVAADPAGVALLLSGPVGRELWPGPQARFGGPARAGVGFVVPLAVVGDTTTGRGRLSVSGGSGPGTSVLRLVLAASGAGADRLRGDARRFVDDLADVAQARSSAA